MVDLSLWPQVPVSQRSCLPAESAVYAALSGSRALYIGATKNLRKRWVRHNQLRRLVEEGDSVIAWQLCPVNQLSALERGLIGELKPILNRTLLNLLRPICARCRSSKVRFRHRTQDHVCDTCGHVWPKESWWAIYLSAESAL